MAPMFYIVKQYGATLHLWISRGHKKKATKKTPHTKRLFGGEGGIRTHDEFPRTRFPGERPRPLGDLSRRFWILDFRFWIGRFGSDTLSKTQNLKSKIEWAERVGFEPTESCLDPHSFSRRAPSTARTPLQKREPTLRAALLRGWRVSNPRPLSPQPNALSTELQPHGSFCAY